MKIENNHMIITDPTEVSVFLEEEVEFSDNKKSWGTGGCLSAIKDDLFIIGFTQYDEPYLFVRIPRETVRKHLEPVEGEDFIVLYETSISVGPKVIVSGGLKKYQRNYNQVLHWKAILFSRKQTDLIELWTWLHSEEEK